MYGDNRVFAALVLRFPRGVLQVELANLRAAAPLAALSPASSIPCNRLSKADWEYARACSVVMRLSVGVECALSVGGPVADGAGEEAGGSGARDQHDGWQRQERSSQKGNWSVVDSHPRSKVIASRADLCPLSPRSSRSDMPGVMPWQLVKHGYERVWRYKTYFVRRWSG